MVTNESHMRTDGYDNARSESSHHCPKSRQGAVANEVEIERIGTHHSTVSPQAEQVTTRHSRCNDVKIERIGTSHPTVSQQAEQVRIDTGQWATQKDDRGRTKIVCRSSESRTELRIESPMNPNINSEIQVTLLRSHDGNRQWIWSRSRRWSDEFSKEAKRWSRWRDAEPR